MISENMPKQKPILSVVSPVYGCAGTVIELYLRLKKLCETENLSFELLLVDDGSPDNSWPSIEELSMKDERVKGILLSRNFGQHNAIAAGLEHSCGEWVVVMDCDLQDQPEEIIKLYKKALEGYDIVLGKRQERKDRFIKKFLSKTFYRVLSYLTQTEQDSTIGNFGIYRDSVIKAVCSLGDQQRFFPTMVKWVGFRQTSITIEHSRRNIGKTSYSFRKTLNLALDVMLAFSDRPLKLIVKFGVYVSLFSLVYTTITLIRYMAGGIKVMGYTSLIISVWFFSGIIIVILGIVGLYIGKTYEKVKSRPNYIIKSIKNIETK
ncbi:MAG: glycosyltransferase family 2 protein [Bacteroidales bacterium]|nr:glycosyltransferase family 2 protein [Bacteroidales bacterium]MCB9000078.1 glycosyltransferase family 2 protein [Bacteroidales bacterium]MCB9012727.1 glycosyltransferase family 2 protein [Bacteroidales bacterium]